MHHHVRTLPSTLSPGFPGDPRPLARTPTLHGSRRSSHPLIFPVLPVGLLPHQAFCPVPWHPSLAPPLWEAPTASVMGGELPGEGAAPAGMAAQPHIPENNLGRESSDTLGAASIRKETRKADLCPQVPWAWAGRPSGSTGHGGVPSPRCLWCARSQPSCQGGVLALSFPPAVTECCLLCWQVTRDPSSREDRSCSALFISARTLSSRALCMPFSRAHSPPPAWWGLGAP